MSGMKFKVNGSYEYINGFVCSEYYK